MCAVFHVISQGTDLVGHIQPLETEVLSLLLTLTRGITKVSLNTATINADFLHVGKRPELNEHHSVRFNQVKYIFRKKRQI